MEITPEIRAIKNAYMKAKDEKNQPEMNRLKSEAMTLMNQEEPVKAHEKESGDHDGIIRSKNEDGDSMEISTAGQKRQKLDQLPKVK